MIPVNAMHTHAVRLQPGDDLRISLEQFCTERKIEAGVLLSCVGSFRQAVLRFAGRDEGTLITGPLEIVAATGTLSRHGLHVHLTVANANGEVTGGHLLRGCMIYTTAEVVIGECSGLIFQREKDAQTGYDELVIRSSQPEK